MRLRDLINIVEGEKLEEFFGRKKKAEKDPFAAFADMAGEYQAANRKVPAEVRGARCNNPDKDCRNAATHIKTFGTQQRPICDACDPPAMS